MTFGKKKQEIQQSLNVLDVFELKVGELYKYFMIIVTVLLLPLLMKTRVCCLPFGQYLLLIAFEHRQSRSSSSASRGMTLLTGLAIIYLL